MKYMVAFLIMFTILVPAYLFAARPPVNTAAQEIDGASLPYASEEKYPLDGSSMASTKLRRSGGLSIPEGARLNTSTIVSSDRYPHISHQTKGQQENGFPRVVSQPCSLAPNPAVEVSVDVDPEYVAVEYEMYEYELPALLSRRKRSGHYLKPQPIPINQQKYFTEFPTRIPDDTSTDGNISQKLNATKNGNRTHMIGFREGTERASSISVPSDLFPKQSTALISRDADSFSESSSTHGSISSNTRTSSTAFEVLGNYCDGDSIVDDISFKSCPSCESRCGEVGIVTEKRVLCSCDRTCLVYRDCCPDFEMRCTEQYTEGLTISTSMSVSWDSSCVMLRTSDGYINRYLFISECNGTAYELVENRAVPTASGGVPVEDMVTGLFFINYDCAKCHGASNLRPMHIKLTYNLQQCGANQDYPGQLYIKPRHNETQSRSTSADTESTDPGRFQTTADMAGHGESMHVGVKGTIIPSLAPSGIIPKLRYTFVGDPPRICHDKLIDRCSESCSNSRLIELCLKSGFMYTTFDDPDYRFITFKNVYCAICYTESDDFTCGDINHKDWGSGYDPDLSVFSLSLLFDFNNGPEISSVGIVCDEGQVILPNGMVATTSCVWMGTVFKTTHVHQWIHHRIFQRSSYFW